MTTIAPDLTTTDLTDELPPAEHDARARRLVLASQAREKAAQLKEERRSWLSRATALERHAQHDPREATAAATRAACAARRAARNDNVGPMSP